MHTHTLLGVTPSLYTEKSLLCTGLWVKVNNFTRADRFSSFERDGERDREKERERK